MKVSKEELTKEYKNLWKKLSKGECIKEDLLKHEQLMKDNNISDDDIRKITDSIFSYDTDKSVVRLTV